MPEPKAVALAAHDLLFQQHEETVRADWIDYSGHMNFGYFLLSFENASSAFFRHLDLSQAHRERTNHALFAAETHLTFKREVKLGDRLRFTTQLLGWAPKWINWRVSRFPDTRCHLSTVTRCAQCRPVPDNSRLREK